jgi:hypothetical protein
MQQANYAYSKPTIFRQAWATARHDAKLYGGKPRHHFPTALRQAWERAKATRELRGRFLATVERIRFEQSEIGRARHEKLVAECAARAEAGVARSVEIVRRLTRQPVREAA